MKILIVLLFLVIANIGFAQGYYWSDHDTIRSTTDSMAILSVDKYGEYKQLRFYNVASTDKFSVFSITSDKQGNDTVPTVMRVLDGNQYATLDTNVITVGTNVQVPTYKTLIIEILDPFCTTIRVKWSVFSTAKQVPVWFTNLSF